MAIERDESKGDYSRLLEERISSTEDRVERHDGRLRKLEGFQSWVMGIGTTIAFGIGLAAKQTWQFITGNH